MRRVSLACCAAFTLAVTHAASAQVQRAKLVGAGLAEGDSFGRALAMSGDTILIGAPYDDELAEQSGAAYVFQKQGDAWARIQKLKASDASFGDVLGDAVALDGDVAVIGAHGDWPGGVQAAGSAYVFERIGGAWTQVAKLVASDPGTDARLGMSVAVRGLRILVGAQMASPFGLHSGAVYVFEKQGGNWVQTAKLVSGDPAYNERFGNALALWGELALIGCASDNNTGPLASSGAAYMFERQAQGWVQVQKLTASDPVTYDYFGWSVALEGNTALIGSTGNDQAALNGGAVYVFQLQGSTWFEIQKLTAIDAGMNHKLGVSVALSGDLAVAGALTDDDMGQSSGSAYAFQRQGSTWIQAGKLLALDGTFGDLLGAAVALTGTTALTGAPGDDVACPGACDTGSAYVFDLARDAAQYGSCPTGSPCNNPDDHGGCASMIGEGAILAAGGSASVALDELELHVTRLPPNKAGLVFMGGAPDTVIFANGIRRVGTGGAGLYRFPARNGGALGMIVEGPGIAAWSQAQFPTAGHIAPGSSWYFQCWYRDPAGPCGQTSNFSSAVEVLFSP